MWAATAIITKDIDCGEIIENISNKKIYPILKAGAKITITKGREYEYAIWHPHGIMDVPQEYINEETIKVFSK